MNSFQAVACAFLVCVAIGGAHGDYYSNYKGDITKIVVYGKDKVILPTMKNMIIVCAEFLEQSAKYAPKAIRSEIEDLVYKMKMFSGNNKQILALAQSILYKIQKGYITDCDFAKELEESMQIVQLLYSNCADDYTYYYKN